MTRPRYKQGTRRFRHSCLASTYLVKAGGRSESGPRALRRRRALQVQLLHGRVRARSAAHHPSARLGQRAVGLVVVVELVGARRRRRRRRRAAETPAAAIDLATQPGPGSESRTSGKPHVRHGPRAAPATRRLPRGAARPGNVREVDRAMMPSHCRPATTPAAGQPGEGPRVVVGAPNLGGGGSCADRANGAAGAAARLAGRVAPGPGRRPWAGLWQPPWLGSRSATASAGAPYTAGPHGGARRPEGGARLPPLRLGPAVLSRQARGADLYSS